MKLRKYTAEQLEAAIQSSTSYRQVLQKLNVAAAGGNYEVLKRAIIYFALDITHFTGKGSNKGRSFGPKRPLSDYLSNSHAIQSNKLKKRLLKEHVFEHKCNCCKGTTWLGQCIPLELHHLNGQSNDNTLENLTLICPNCHALTDNYRGKNKTS